MTYSIELSQRRRFRWVVIAAFGSLAFGAGSVAAGEVSRRGADMPTVEQDFQFHCAACHGIDGKGGGPVAKVLKIDPPDLTRISERHGGAFPQRMVFDAISGLNMPVAHGTREMPVWGDQFVGENLRGSGSLEDAQEAVSEVGERILRLTGYIRSIQATK